MTIRELLDANQEEISRLYRHGDSTCALGRKFNCSNSYIWQSLKRWGEPLRQTKVVEPNRDKILVLHSTGKSAYSINKELGISHGAAERCIAAAGIDISQRKWHREDPIVNHRDEITNRYLSGEGVTVIAKDYKCQDATIIRSLRRWGIKLRSLRDYSYPVDESFFDTIDTEAKAYTLGFWMADGCNQSNIPVTTISITDRDILAEMMLAMSYEGPIHEVPPQKENHKPQYRVSLGSRRLCDALTKVGCVSRKTYHATFPTDEQVPSLLHRHLIRGWMDGDGTITCKPGRRHWHCRIVGTEAACRGLSACVARHLGFPGSICPVYKGATHTTWAFTVGSRDKLKIYLEWLYQDATIFLARKHAKYQEFLASV